MAMCFGGARGFGGAIGVGAQKRQEGGHKAAIPGITGRAFFKAGVPHRFQLRQQKLHCQVTVFLLLLDFHMINCFHSGEEQARNVSARIE